MIFAKTDFRVADGADKAALEIRAAADEIENFTGVRIHHEAIDGEIAADRVLAGAAFEMNAGGAAAVSVIAITAKRGHLDLRTGVADQDDAKVGADRAGAGEQIQDFGGRGVGGNVEILWGTPEQEVANAAADEVRLASDCT